MTLNATIVRSVLSAACLFALAGAARADLPNGVASGETTQNSSLLWARSDTTGLLRFDVSTDPTFASGVTSFNASVVDPALPVKMPVSGLAPGTQYYYRAVDAASSVSAGRFKTAPAANSRGGVRFGASGDWRGDVGVFSGVKNVPGRNLDFFVALGDTIYADVASPALPIPQAQTLADYRTKHAEVYSAHGGINPLADLRRSTSVIAMIDDHEVINDFAGGATIGSDPRFTGPSGNLINTSTLYNNGIQAFHEYNPINPQTWSGTGDARFDGRPDLYRANAAGKTAAMFTLDARSFRDQELPGLPLNQITNPAAVAGFIGSTFTPGRTMLGNPQVNRLKADLLAAEANGTTWKFINVPEPIQNLGPLGASDRFEGYAAERNDLLRFIDQNHIQNVVFVTADIHGTVVNNVTYNNGPLQPQIPTGAFEISVGSVGYDAPFGPTIAGFAAQANLPGSIPLNTYLSLPGAQQEAYIQAIINGSIAPLGYDTLGLTGSPIDATLLQGTWTATNSYGWTEFDIDPVTQYLTVTTYGVPWYPASLAQANPAAFAGLNPTIVQQFVVRPVPSAGGVCLLGLAGVLGMGRRRR